MDKKIVLVFVMLLGCGRLTLASQKPKAAVPSVKQLELQLIKQTLGTLKTAHQTLRTEIANDLNNFRDGLAIDAAQALQVTMLNRRLNKPAATSVNTATPGILRQLINFGLNNIGTIATIVSLVPTLHSIYTQSRPKTQKEKDADFERAIQNESQELAEADKVLNQHLDNARDYQEQVVKNEALMCKYPVGNPIRTALEESNKKLAADAAQRTTVADALRAKQQKKAERLGAMAS